MAPAFLLVEMRCVHCKQSIQMAAARDLLDRPICSLCVVRCITDTTQIFMGLLKASSKARTVPGMKVG